MPKHPLTVPTQAEMGLVYGAKYESDLRIDSAQARRRFHTVGTLVGVASLVFAYDVTSLFIGS